MRERGVRGVRGRNVEGRGMWEGVKGEEGRVEVSHRKRMERNREEDAEEDINDTHTEREEKKPPHRKKTSTHTPTHTNRERERKPHLSLDGH